MVQVSKVWVMLVWHSRQTINLAEWVHHRKCTQFSELPHGERHGGGWALIELVLMFLEGQQVINPFDHVQAFQE
jgi:hypothetical protein